METLLPPSTNTNGEPVSHEPHVRRCKYSDAGILTECNGGVGAVGKGNPGEDGQVPGGTAGPMTRAASGH